MNHMWWMETVWLYSTGGSDVPFITFRINDPGLYLHVREDGALTTTEDGGAVMWATNWVNTLAILRWHTLQNHFSTRPPGADFQTKYKGSFQQFI